MSETTTTENAVMPSVKINPIELSFQTNEAVKMLRANLQFSGYGLRAIALTSCNPNEGKSWVSFELARSLAELGKRTLFLDCDIRNSVLQSRLGINEKLPGLTDFLVGKASVGEILCKTNLSHLHMVFAGSVSPNPAELLSDQMFERLCEALKKNYDYIIMDTVPLGVVIDAAIVARHCDGMILVVEAAGTDRKQAQRVKTQLDAAGIRTLGVVMNRAGGHGGSYGYGYGYGYGNYGNYGEKSDSGKAGKGKKKS